MLWHSWAAAIPLKYASFAVHTLTHTAFTTDARCHSIQSTARFRLFIYLLHIRARLVENVLELMRLRTSFLHECTSWCCCVYFFPTSSSSSFLYALTKTGAGTCVCQVIHFWMVWSTWFSREYHSMHPSQVLCKSIPLLLVKREKNPLV